MEKKKKKCNIQIISFLEIDHYEVYLVLKGKKKKL